jgi:hypothetical protein
VSKINIELEQKRTKFFVEVPNEKLQSLSLTKNSSYYANVEICISKCFKLDRKGRLSTLYHSLSVLTKLVGQMVLLTIDDKFPNIW